MSSWFVKPDADGLSCWERRGFEWEMRCQDRARDYGVRVRGNPRDAKEWKRRVGKGCDMFLGLDVLNDVDVECKWTDESNNYKVQPSWIIRDYLPRFDDADPEHRHIVLTNDLSKFHDDTTTLLEEHNIELWNLEKLQTHLILWTYIQQLILTLWITTTNRRTHITTDYKALLPPTTILCENMVFDTFYIPRLRGGGSCVLY